MATLMVSLALNLPVMAELSLGGSICGVVSVEEKVQAAKEGEYWHINFKGL